MSESPEATSATTATATVGNAEIIGFEPDLWGNAVVIICDDNGKIWNLDRRAVNTSFLKLGQRGWLEYREYVLGNGYGSRWFFDPAA